MEIVSAQAFYSGITIVLYARSAHVCGIGHWSLQHLSTILQMHCNLYMVEEVQRLLDRGISPEDLIYYGLEYKYLTLYVTNQLSYNEMFRELEIAIHQFAKRQMTWFRGMERRGINIHWIDYNLSLEEKIAVIENKLNEN